MVAAPVRSTHPERVGTGTVLPVQGMAPMIKHLWRRCYRIVWRKPTATDKAAALATGLVGVAMATSLVLPGRKTAKIIEAQTRGMANVLRAATGANEVRTPTPQDDVPTIHTHRFVEGEWKRQ